MIQGVDISGTWQGLLNWDKAVQAGMRFALIKGSDGANGRTTLFKENVKAANERGILTIGYHYAHFGDKMFNEQVANIKATFGDASLTMKDYPLMLDFEEKDQADKTALNNYACKLVQAVHTWIGKWPIIYTSQGWWEWSQIPWWEDLWGKCPLHIANWNVATPSLPRNAKWTKWLIWQYTVASNGDDYGVVWQAGAPRPKIDLDQWGNLAPWPGDNPPPEPPPPPPPAGKTMHLEGIRLDTGQIYKGDLMA